MKLHQIGTLVALACATPVHADRPFEEALVISAAVADLATTEVWLHASETAVEANPLMQHRGVRLASKAAGTVGLLYLSRLLDKHGKPGYARALRYSTAAVWFGAAGWNVSLVVRY